MTINKNDYLDRKNLSGKSLLVPSNRSTSSMIKKPNLRTLPKITPKTQFGGARLESDNESDEDDEFSLPSASDEIEFGPISTAEIITFQSVRTLPTYEKINLNPDDLINNLKGNMIDKMEIGVMTNLLVNRDYRFKSMADYEQLLNQNQLALNYVPTQRGVRLNLNQSWLQVVLHHKPVDLTRIKSLFTSLEDSTNYGNKDPINTLNIINDLNAFEQVPNNQFWVELLNNSNVIARVGSKTKRQLRNLGQIGKVITGGSDLIQKSYQNGLIINYELDGQPIRQGHLDYLSTIDGMLNDSLNKAQKASISGTHVQPRGYYKLPIGVNLKSFYSNVWLGDRVKLIENMVESDLAVADFQTRVSHTRVSNNDFMTAFEQITYAKNVQQVWQVFDKQVIDASEWLDLVQAEALLAYFNLDLKYVNHDDLKFWSNLSQNKKAHRFDPVQFETLTNDYLINLQKSEHPYYPSLGKNVIQMPEYLVWSKALDGPTQATGFICDQLLNSSKLYKEAGTDFWTDDLARRLRQKNATEALLETNKSSSPESTVYRGFIRNFPSEISQEALNDTEIWISEEKQYRTRVYYQALRQLKSLERLAKIQDSLKEDKSRLIDDLIKSKCFLDDEINYYNFQKFLVSVDLTRFVGKLEDKSPKGRSFELEKIRQVVKNMPEFERLKYLAKALQNYRVDDMGGLRDIAGYYVCCKHVLRGIQMGQQYLLDNYANEEGDCIYCGASLALPSYDDEEEYTNGFREVTHSPAFYQENALDKLKRFNRLTKFVDQRFLKPLEDVLSELPESIITKFLIDFKNQIPEDIGLTKNQRANSLFLNPDVSSYLYLKDLWLYDIQRQLDDQVKTIVVEDALERFYLAQLVYVARIAFATALLTKIVFNEQPDKIENTQDLLKNRFIRVIMTELVRITNDSNNIFAPKSLLLKNYFKRVKDVNPPLVVANPQTDLPLDPNDLNNIISGLKLFDYQKIIGDSGELLKEIAAEPTQSWNEDYWLKLYLFMVNIYTNQLIEPDNLIQLKQAFETRVQDQPAIINQTTLISAQMHEQSTPDSPAYCRYFHQQRYQYLAQLYALFNRLTNKIGVISKNFTFSHKKLSCIIDDRFYYITRLIKGEVPIDQLNQLLVIINKYESVSDKSDFQEAFISLVNDQTQDAGAALNERDINLLNSINETIEYLSKFNEQSSECFYKDQLLVTSIQKGRTRPVRAIAVPLSYQFLNHGNDVPQDFDDLNLKLETDVTSQAEFFNKISNKANTELNQLFNRDFNELFKKAIQYHYIDKKTTMLQFQTITNETLSARDFVNQLGRLSNFTIKEQTQMYREQFPQTTKSAFYLWRQSLTQRNSYNADLRTWLLNVDQKEVNFWHKKARLAQLTINPCILENVKPDLTTRKFDTIKQLVLYIEIFRFFLITFQNNLIYPNTDDVDVLLPSMKVILNELRNNQDKMTGIFKRNPVKPDIKQFPLGTRQPENQITFITSSKQIDQLIMWLQKEADSLVESPINSATKILNQEIWQNIDCIDQDSYQDLNILDRNEPYQKKLNDLITVLKWILLNDINLNLKQTLKKPDEQYFKALIQEILLLIAQMDAVQNTSAEYVNLTMKYHFFSFYQEMRKKTSRVDSFDQNHLDQVLNNFQTALEDTGNDEPYDEELDDDDPMVDGGGLAGEQNDEESYNYEDAISGSLID